MSRRERGDLASEKLLTAAAATRDIRHDVAADHVLIGLSRISLAAGESSQRQQAERLTGFPIDALRSSRLPCSAWLRHDRGGCLLYAGAVVSTLPV